MYNFQAGFLPQDKLYILEPQTKSLLARESLNYFTTTTSATNVMPSTLNEGLGVLPAEIMQNFN